MFGGSIRLTTAFLQSMDYKIDCRNAWLVFVWLIGKLRQNYKQWLMIVWYRLLCNCGTDSSIQSHDPFCDSTSLSL